MIKNLALSLLIVDMIVFSVLSFFFDDSLSKSFLFSSLLLLINLVGLALMWKVVLIYKKSALVTLVALIKYPLIGLSIYWAGRQSWINANGVVIGICSFLIIIVVTVLINLKIKKA